MSNAHQTRYKVARFSHRIRHHETEACYLKALSSDLHSWRTWFHYAEFLSECCLQDATKKEALIMALGVTARLSPPHSDIPERLKDLVSNCKETLKLSENIWGLLSKELTTQKLNSYWNARIGH